MSQRWRGGGGGGNRRSAKELSKNRFSKLDADIASAYVDDDDDNAGSFRSGRADNRNAGSVVTRVVDRLANGIFRGRGRNNQFGGRSNYQAREQQLSKGAAGKNAEIVHKIKVMNGKRYTSQWILKQLYQQVEDIKPILVSTTQRGDVEFYVKSPDVAESVQAISRRIVHKPSGERVTFIAERCTAPWTRIKPDEVEVVNSVVDSRFDRESRAIDLSEFAHTKVFKDRDLAMMLTKNNVMMTVVDRIDEKFGSITALSLKGNRLHFLDYAAALVHVTKFLKVLDISFNQIDKISELEKLKGLPLETLFFEGNPLADEMTSATAYLSAMQEIFPRLICLDGLPVAPSAHVSSLADEDIAVEPPIKPSFYPDQNLRPLVEQFIVEFFKEYDGENGAASRKNLMAAYDTDNSTFTLTIANMKDTAPVRYSDDNCWSNYIRVSHNILRADKWSRNRESRSFRGSMDIAVALSKLPVTNHYKESFVVDVSYVSNNLMGFSVQGLFEDGKLSKGEEVPILKFFSRSFMVAPRENNALAVISDMLFISAVTQERVARYKLLLNKANQAPVQQEVQQPVAVPGTSAEPTPDVKQQMVEKFSLESGMLQAWSQKCLEDNQWNYDAAGHAFMENRANIPQEAFRVV